MILRTAIAFLLAGTALAQVTPQPGITVFQPIRDTTTYAVDLNGTVIHTWPGTTTPGTSVYMAPNGDLVRTQNIASGPGGGGGGGGIERVDWNGQVLWNFQYTSPLVHSHHDIALMPNGNVLMIAWENVGGPGAVAAGRSPSTVGTAFWSEHIIEVQPDGTGGASVVWQWHAMDHLVQNFNSGLPNFDLPSDRPERININFPAGSAGPSGDWLHFNGLDYNPELDQIVISSRTLSEVWIIDHGTTTQEAAGSTGGLRGRGGDLLYRWGNPAAYDRGTGADQTLYGQHDCQWIDEGLPGAGNLLIFNNGQGRPGGNYSSADEVIPPLNPSGVYDLVPAAAFGPALAVSSSTHPTPASFYSPTTSGCERQPNGNTMMVEGDSGLFIEVNSAGALVWTWQSPFPTTGAKRTFKARRHAGGVTGLAYCDPANANSTGMPGVLKAVGSTVVSENSLELWVQDLPQSEFGFFVNGTGNAVTPLAGGSSGDLCVSTSLGRYNDLSEIFHSGGTGTGSLVLDLNNTATPMGRVSILAGQTWYFQCWYRDTPGMTSNFTNAVEVSF
ncbi:MAG: hypothetical protein ACI87O_003181, partial [Planctomycetota bacterium]